MANRAIKMPNTNKPTTVAKTYFKKLFITIIFLLF